MLNNVSVYCTAPYLFHCMFFSLNVKLCIVHPVYMIVGKETSVIPPSSELQKKLKRLLSFPKSVQNTLPVGYFTKLAVSLTFFFVCEIVSWEEIHTFSTHFNIWAEFTISTAAVDCIHTI